ncbi:formamidopyrimidine-DNA glycosylase [Brachybacterium avium]|uniref:DNA-(apurinic or apyrimidinic site) lyase n=1 Tax=Brachybacterium avium TaxID=2017485 RepID=A0A220UAD3_9MICO|nr:DNA-formamidopyrimidine glycosylase family protein [Brachybacterium avium]ASK64841.1 formamidopyrimidine-DNA glycosylase [Brachybacterium avium]
MPEGDTVARQCRILDDALAGAVLTACDLRVPRAATTDLVGWTVREVRPRGKHLLMRLDPPGPGAAPLTLHTHLMMDGIWHVDGRPLRSSDTSAGPRPDHTIRIALTARHHDGQETRAIAYDVKQVRLVRTADEDTLVGQLGPDLLDPAWAADPGLRERAVSNLGGEPERPLGLALLDQHLLAGIGNIYRSELCFLARLHPAAPVRAVGDLGQIVDIAHRLLRLNSDRAVRVTTGGMIGRDGDLWVYGRGGRPCRRCRTRIVRGELGEPRLEGAEARVLWFCPRCQAGP